MKLFTFFWIMSLLLAVGIQHYHREGSVSITGVAEADFLNLTVEKDAEISKLYVKPGGVFAKGDTLLVFSRPEIDQQIAEYESLLAGEKGKKTLRNLETQQEYARLRADFASRENEIQAELQRLENRYLKNQKISKALGASARGQDSTSGLLYEIKNLKQTLESERQAFRNRSGALLATGRSEVVYNKEYLQKAIASLKKEKQELVVLAPFQGVVSKVLKAEGEKVNAFVPIVVLSKMQPQRIRAYLFENSEREVVVGEAFPVTSARLSAVVQGKVIGIGKEITAFPERLKKMKDQLLWGREVIIELPSENPFLINEKVQVVLP